ncbi:MAG: quinol:electron acceptor oxidoreductase subunit ActD [Candidatus Sericytochromatia bacterium]
MSKSQAMNDPKLYAITGLFDTPDEIMHAAEKASQRYRKFDVHTPYPVHGMDDAMGLGESKIGWVTLVVGTTCMLLMLAFIAWVSLVDYPNVWAGKPFFNLPAYIPILFEVTVLTGAVTTVLTLFFIVSGFPRNTHPLHDTPYMQRTSDDKFGLCIEAADPAFDDADARSFLQELGAQNILAIHEDPKEAESGLSLGKAIFVGWLVLVAIAVSGAGYFGLNRMVFLPPYNWMSVQDKVVAQATNTVFKDGRSMQRPVEGTVPRGYLPEPSAEDALKMVAFMPNPLPRDEATFAMGKQQFESKCSACHGYYGEGDSRLNGQFPAPPTLHSEKVVNWPDAQIYHVITYGQNIMPSYAKQLTKEERWAIAHYIRALQRSLNPKETDQQ